MDWINYANSSNIRSTIFQNKGVKLRIRKNFFLNHERLYIWVIRQYRKKNEKFN